MKKIYLIASFALLCVAGSVAWSQVELTEDYPDTYVVQQGDTLWDISGNFLTEPWLWPEIWYANDQVANPHLIYPGDVLRLVFVDGRPMLTRDTGTNGTVKLTPSIREISDFEAIPAIDLSKIREFLNGNRVLDSSLLDGLPYMVAGDQKRVIVGGGDIMYARGDLADDSTLVYGVFRIGDAYIDPETEEELGVRALELAMVREEEVTGDIGRYRVARSTQEMTAGDVLLPYEDELFDPVFYPTAPDQSIDGVIIDVEGGVAKAGALDILAINRGSNHGLESGDVLSIMQTGETLRDRVQGDMITIPDYRAGLLMIFKTYPKMSYGIILESQRDITLGDKVYNP